MRKLVKGLAIVAMTAGLAMTINTTKADASVNSDAKKLAKEYRKSYDTKKIRKVSFKVKAKKNGTSKITRHVQKVLTAAPKHLWGDIAKIDDFFSAFCRPIDTTADAYIQRSHGKYIGEGFDYKYTYEKGYAKVTVRFDAKEDYRFKQEKYEKKLYNWFKERSKGMNQYQRIVLAGTFFVSRTGYDYGPAQHSAPTSKALWEGYGAVCEGLAKGQYRCMKLAGVEHVGLAYDRDHMWIVASVGSRVYHMSYRAFAQDTEYTKDDYMYVFSPEAAFHKLDGGIGVAERSGGTADARMRGCDYDDWVVAKKFQEPGDKINEDYHIKWDFFYDKYGEGFTEIEDFRFKDSKNPVYSKYLERLGLKKPTIDDGAFITDLIRIEDWREDEVLAQLGLTLDDIGFGWIVQP